MKKVGLGIILVLIIIAIGLVVVHSSSGKKEEKTASTNTTLGNKIEEEILQEEEISIEEENTADSKNTIVATLEDGTLYSVTEEEITPDIVIGDNYFDTQLSDININFSQYAGKTIEIEGYYLSNMSYTFVGRYSTSNLCAYCPTGYSYFEYEWKGDQTPELVDEDSWIKVQGTLTQGDDEGVEYYYIDVASLEVMNEKGLDTVNN